MFIQYHDIIIRNTEVRDCAQLAAWWNDGSVMAHAGFPLGLGTSTEKIAEEIASDSDDTVRRLVIEYRGRLIGETHWRNKGGGTAEIGIKICETAYQEKGLGRVILSLLIRDLFDRGYSKIILDTNLRNTRAQHVYEMLGFRKLRVHEDFWQDQVGVWQSFIDYELVPEDFRDFAGKTAEEEKA